MPYPVAAVQAGVESYRDADRLPWWNGLYIAYDAASAASLAASYSNLSNPGTNDATVGSAPTWAAGRGWIFDGSKYLIANVVPGENWTMICQFSHNSDATLNIVCGSLKSGANRFWLWPQETPGTFYRNYGYGGERNIANGYIYRGLMGFSGTAAYLNGAADGTIGAGTLDFLAPYIGGLNNGGSLGFGWTGHVQRFALHNGAISAGRMADIMNKMTAAFTPYYYWAFGDSVTEGSGASDAAHRYTNLIAAARSLTLTNGGIASTTLQNTVQNSVTTIGGAVSNNGRDRYFAAINSALPDTVTILYGLNDLRLNDAAFTVENFQNDLGEVVAGIKGRGVYGRNIIIGSPPYIPATSYALYAPWDGATAEKYTAYRAACAAVAVAQGVRYVDVYAAMAAGGGDSLISADNIHPNDAGHAVIANAFLAAM